MKYELYNLIFLNGKRYIGISQDSKKRFVTHKALARSGYPQAVYRAIRKYGDNSVKLKILAVGEKDYILEMEKKAIFIFKTMNKKFGYNMSPGGEISPVAGIGHSKKSKRKMSISQKNRIHTPEEIAKMAASLKGRVFSEEHKEKLSFAASKRKIPEQIRTKISASLKGNIPWNKGIPRSNEVKRRISDSLKGHSATIGFTGRKHSEETKQRMRESHLKRVA